MIGKLQIAHDMSALIGKTPMCFINKLTVEKRCVARVAVKLEQLNPLASVKDRIALTMITEAEKQGRITPGKTILVEPTAGNTGIGLAFVGPLKGYKVICVMPSSCSMERRMLIRTLGAELYLTDPSKGVMGVVDRAREIVAEIGPDADMLAQFDNPANPLAHYDHTGPEIWEQTAGTVDFFVGGSGTGGTVTGVGRFLKEKNPKIKIVAVEPEESPAICAHMKGNLEFKPARHGIQGMGPGFIPGTLDTSFVDFPEPVHTDEAIATARQLAAKEGIVAGISGGAAVAAALRIGARPENEGKLIVALCPSGGERYLSTPLFDHVRAECINMTFPGQAPLP